MSEKKGVRNLYKVIKSDDTKRDYPGFEKTKIPLGSRVIINGPSGCGKTNAALNLILDMDVFDRIYLYAKDVNQALYENFIRNIRETEKKTKTHILFVSQSLKNLVSPEELDKTHKNLVIIDDFICDKKADLDKVATLFVRGRRYATFFFLSQKFYKIPNLLRENANVVAFMGFNNAKDRNRVMSEYATGIDSDTLSEMSNACMMDEKGDPSMRPFFVMVDERPSEKYRFGYTTVPKEALDKFKEMADTRREQKNAKSRKLKKKVKEDSSDEEEIIEEEKE